MKHGSIISAGDVACHKYKYVQSRVILTVMPMRGWLGCLFFLSRFLPFLLTSLAGADHPGRQSPGNQIEGRDDRGHAAGCGDGCPDVLGVPRATEVRCRVLNR